MTTADLHPFAYRAQTAPGMPISGTVDAADGDDAQKRLTAMGLRVIELAPAERPPRPQALRGSDFAAFNQQLAQLTAAGLPVETGLRLIAQDMRRGRLAASIRAVAEELEKGVPLAEAFEAHRRRFPPLYGRLIDAGVRSHNLPAMLLGLGRHLELLHRLRVTLWQAAAYPIVVFATATVLLLFLSLAIIPAFAQVVDDFGTQLPLLTRFVIAAAAVVPWLIGLLVAAIVIAVVGLRLVRRVRPRSVLADRIVVGTPLLGPVLRYNLLARWCDALRLGVEAGLPLPQAIELAGDASGSAGLRHDSRRMIEELSAGGRTDHLERPVVMARTVPLTIDLGSRRGDLAPMLEHLSQMYQQQAELRLATLRNLLAPALLIFIALIVGTVMLAVILPLLALLTNLVGGGVIVGGR